LQRSPTSGVRGGQRPPRQADQPQMSAKTVLRD
jgi:hypothetical protein